ncbi:MAG TPA: chromate transporter [Pyrinomonadaceae bacterium]
MPGLPPERSAPVSRVSFGEAFRFWVKLGFISFGGPAGQIAIMHRELVERRRWLSDERFLHALNYCMILPGPEATQLAIYIGWLMHRTIGGIVAGAFFVIPSIVILLALSYIYAKYGQLNSIAGVVFRADNVLTLRTALSLPKYTNEVTRTQFYSHVLTRARALPGVTSAAYISFLPMVFRGGIFPVTVPGVAADKASSAQASIRFVTPDFFSTLQIPLRRGRDVSDRDSMTAPFVVVVSESLASRLWPGQDPIGQQLNVAFFDRMVVGVVGDISTRGLERSSEPQIYLPSQQVPDGGLPAFAPKDLVVHTAGNPASLAPALRHIIHEADPEQSISDVRPLEDIVLSETDSRRIQLRVLGAFTLIAFLLAAVGIYGLLSFTVSTRTQEVGIRLALGAKPRNILSMFLRQGLVLGVAGVVVGVPLAYLAARSMGALLFGVQPDDLLIYTGASLLVLLMTLLGSLGPAIRAARVNPAICIRSE